VVPGDRVALRGPNCPELIVAAIAAWKVGAVVSLVPALARAGEVSFFLEDTQPRVLVLAQREEPAEAAAIDAAGLPAVVSVPAPERPGHLSWTELLERAGPRPAVATDLDRVAIVWHTGGTTGRPKGCYHTQRRFLLAGRSIGTATGAAPGQRWSAAAPIGHALGFIHSTNFALLAGATLVLVERFTRPEVLLDAISAHRVTNFTAIAATWAGMLSSLRTTDAPDPVSLRTCYAMWQSSSSSEVSDHGRARGVTLLNNFGSTAFATWVLVPPLDGSAGRAALGAAAPGYEVRAVEPGEGGGLEPLPAGRTGQMAVRGPSGLTYWRLPEKQRQDVSQGFTLQDDLIRFDDHGIADYLGRTDFMISSAGNKIAPVEVETVLVGHPAVRETVVIGLPDPLRQEMVAAFVVLHDPAAAGAELRRELQDLVKSRLAPYKYPRRLEFIEELPRDHVGKVQPRVVRERALADHAPDLSSERSHS
jgi:2-aminobenzoate-CoA ligase